MEALELQVQLNFKVEKSTHSSIILCVNAHTGQYRLLYITELRAFFKNWERLMLRVNVLPRVPQQFNSKAGARISEAGAQIRLDGLLDLALPRIVMITCCVPGAVQPSPVPLEQTNIEEFIPKQALTPTHLLFWLLPALFGHTLPFLLTPSASCLPE